MHDDQVLAIVQALVAYLRANPLACDTATGIARWWLRRQAFVSMDALDSALAFLMQQGVIEETVALDGRRRYKRIGTDDALNAALSQAAGASGRSPKPRTH